MPPLTVLAIRMEIILIIVGLVLTLLGALIR
jgi:hypothetical protein